MRLNRRGIVSGFKSLWLLELKAIMQSLRWWTDKAVGQAALAADEEWLDLEVHILAAVAAKVTR